MTFARAITAICMALAACGGEPIDDDSLCYRKTVDTSITSAVVVDHGCGK